MSDPPPPPPPEHAASQAAVAVPEDRKTRMPASIEKSIYLQPAMMVPNSIKEPKQAVPLLPTDIIYQGIMNKKGGMFGDKKWAKRYFVLQRDGNLCYYGSEKEFDKKRDPRGTIPMHRKGVYVVQQSITKRKVAMQLVVPPHERAAEGPIDLNKHNGFYLDGRTYYVEPPDKPSKMHWVDMLARVNPGCVRESRVGGVDYSGYLQMLDITTPLTRPSTSAAAPPTTPISTSSAAREEKEPPPVWVTYFVILRGERVELYATIKDHLPPARVSLILNLEQANLSLQSVLAQTPNSFILSWLQPADNTRRHLHFREVADKKSLPKNLGYMHNMHKSRFYTGKEHEDWLAALGEGIPDKVFGVRLGLACMRSVTSEAQVPRLLVLATKWLNEHGTTERGLYRIPGSRDQVEAYIERFDRAESVSIDEKEQPGNIASLIVQFFKRMPENIFGEQYAPVFTKVCGEENKANPKRIEMLKKLVFMLPQANRCTIRVLVKHLAKIAENSEVNEMTPAKLSMCVYSTNAKALQTLIEHHEAVFGPEDDEARVQNTKEQVHIELEDEEEEEDEEAHSERGEEKKEILPAGEGGITDNSSITAEESKGVKAEEEGTEESQPASVEASASGPKPEMRFCSQCGAKFSPPEAPALTTCATCTAEMTTKSCKVVDDAYATSSGEEEDTSSEEEELPEGVGDAPPGGWD